MYATKNDKVSAKKFLKVHSVLISTSKKVISYIFIALKKCRIDLFIISDNAAMRIVNNTVARI